MTGPNVPALRRRIERRMTAIVSSGTIQQVLDPDTNILEMVFVARWTGKGLVRPMSKESSWFGTDAVTVSATYFDVTLPVDADVKITDKLKVVSSYGDPSLAGQTLNITTLWRDDWNVARRIAATISTG